MKTLCIETLLLSCYSGGPGLVDPCEKKPVDTLTPMGEQQREDITSSAQVGALNHTQTIKLIKDVKNDHGVIGLNWKSSSCDCK